MTAMNIMDWLPIIIPVVLWAIGMTVLYFSYDSRRTRSEKSIQRELRRMDAQMELEKRRAELLRIRTNNDALLKAYLKETPEEHT